MYDALVASYPPVADISFQSMMLWWNPLGSSAVSTLNGNLVLSYWLPGDDKNSGLCLLGTRAIDESICMIFDQLHESGKPARLVHVPEFVVSHMKHPVLFNFAAEQDYDEFIFDVSTFYPLHHATQHMQAEIKRFLSKVDESKIVLRSLDLRLARNRETLLAAAASWQKHDGFNYIGTIDRDAFIAAVNMAGELGVENICLYINGNLAGIQLYQVPADKRYVVATFMEFDTSIQGLGSYMMHAAARWFAESGFRYINFEQDLGLFRLRAEKLAMGPTSYFRKYTITPAVLSF
jgi:hypothetical protein